MKFNCSRPLFTLVTTACLGLAGQVGATWQPMQVAKAMVECGSGYKKMPSSVRYGAAANGDGVPETVVLSFDNKASTKRVLKAILPTITVSKSNAKGGGTDRRTMVTTFELPLDREDVRVKAKDMLVFRDAQTGAEWVANYFDLNDFSNHAPNALSLKNKIQANYCNVAKKSAK